MVISAIDARGVASTNIDRYAYSKEDQLKRDLKIKALKDAKDKASYLVESIGDKLGSALEISESENINYPQPIYRMSMMKTAEAMDSAPQIDFKKIKLSVNIRAVFEIK